MGDGKINISRDLRADFFRGWALIGMLLGHCEWISGMNLLHIPVSRPFGYAQPPHAFVFISGYFFGLMSQKAYQERGAIAMFARSYFRAGQLYLFNLFMLAFVIAYAYCFHGQFFKQLTPEYQIDISGVALKLYETAALIKFPPYLDILPLFIIMFIFMPMFIILIQRSMALAFSVSVSIYLYVQVVYLLGKTDYLPFPGYFFSPLAWQILFFVGMALGSGTYSGAIVIPFKKKYVLAGTIFISLAFLHDYLLQPLNRFLGLGWGWVNVTLYNASFLTPLHVIHFLVLAYVFVYFLPKSWKFWEGRIAWPLVIMGQYSLEVFSLGVVLSYVTGLTMKAHHGGAVMMLSLEAVGLLLSLGLALLLDWRRRLRK